MRFGQALWRAGGAASPGLSKGVLSLVGLPTTLLVDFTPYGATTGGSTERSKAAPYRSCVAITVLVYGAAVVATTARLLGGCR